MSDATHRKKRGRERPSPAAAPSRPPSGSAPMKKKKQKVSSGAPASDTDFFQWLLGVTAQEFFATYFEQRHRVHSHGSARHFYEGVGGCIPPVRWSTEDMLRTVEEHPMHYGTDLNVVRFDPQQKKRVAFKTSGVAAREEVEQCMQSGWSVRVLRPHEFIESISAFIAHMEGIFGCYCGVNSYWTPAKSQGFAPHYDDVDVFLLQLEGAKEWRLYDPPEDVDYLSRHSSEDYVPEMFPTPKETVVLRAGDVLYMPRGTVHQGRTPRDTHSLHITFSANQMNAWADLMRRAAQYTVETLAANHIEWRRALPRTLTRALGAVWHPQFRAGTGLDPLSAAAAAHRAECQSKFREMAAELVMLLTDEANIDVCADVYAKDTVQKLQPPSRASRTRLVPEGRDMDPGSRVRLASGNCCRLLLTVPGEAQLYHSGDNSRVCLQGTLGVFRFEMDYAPALATLLSRYPRYTPVHSLPFPDFDDPEDILSNQLTVAEVLRDAGLLEEEERECEGEQAA